MEKYVRDEIFGTPMIHPKAFVSSEACIVGEVYVEPGVIIAPMASIRADEGAPFFIGKGTNVQDEVVMHGLLNKYVDVEGKQYSIWIGSHCSIAHRALIHGPARIDKKTFVGFDAIIHASQIGRNCFIDFQAVIKNSRIGNNCHIGVGAKVIGVEIGNGKYVGNGVIVDGISILDLPDVPRNVSEADQEFNKEVVDLNKQLVELYRARKANLNSITHS